MKSDKPTEATAYPVSKVIIGANTEFSKKAPEITAFLKAYNSTNAATSAALAYMRDNKASANDAAVHFLKENTDWPSWLPDDVAARVKAALGS